MTSTVQPRTTARPQRAGRQRVLRSRHRFWQVSDLAGSATTGRRVLSGLARDGELQVIRRGLYWRGEPTRDGTTPAPLQTVVTHLMPGPGVGPSGIWAANTLGLAGTAPVPVHAVVPGRPPADLDTVHFAARPTRDRRVSARLTWEEIALLEVLDQWPDTLQIDPDTAVHRVLHLLSTGDLRADQLATAGHTEPGRVRTRLRELLTAHGRPDLARHVYPAQGPVAAATTLGLPGGAA